MQLRRVVVTGIGALTPIGNSASEYFAALGKGTSGVGPITKFDAEKFRTRFAAEVKGFDPEAYFPKKEVRKMDPFVHYAVAVADEAVKHAGLPDAELDKRRVGVIWGSGIGGLRTFVDEVVDFARGDGTPRFSPFFIPKIIIDLSAGHLSMRYGYRGVNYSTVSACATSNHSIGEAYNYIRYGKVDVMLTGGSEAVVNEAAIGGFNAMRALSERNDDPKTASRPFDKDRDGFVLGEGAAALVLEELEHAKARGANILAEVAGVGVSADAYHITAPHPDGLGAIAGMQDALQDAELTPQDVDYLNVHGTSTPLGDVAELTAIKQVFGDHSYNLRISSTKSMTGHLLGAAGAIEALACIYAIQEERIPPTINHFTDDPAVDPNLQLTFNESVSSKVNVAMSNAFGFGGHNASIILKKYD